MINEIPATEDYLFVSVDNPTLIFLLRPWSCSYTCVGSQRDVKLRWCGLGRKMLSLQLLSWVGFAPGNPALEQEPAQLHADNTFIAAHQVSSSVTRGAKFLLETLNPITADWTSGQPMCFQKFTFNQEHTQHELKSGTLPREFISHCLHRCFPTDAGKKCSCKPVGHGSDTSYLLMLRVVASFCPACLKMMTKTRTFIIIQDLRLLRSHLSRPCSALKVLLSCSLKMRNCWSSPCAPLTHGTD